MATNLNVQHVAPSIFEQALSNFKKQLTTEELIYFERTKLNDVHEAIHTIQFDQKQRRCMQTIARIKPFVDCMEQYGKVIEVFLNVDGIVAFVWVCTSVRFHFMLYNFTIYQSLTFNCIPGTFKIHSHCKLAWGNLADFFDKEMELLESLCKYFLWSRLILVGVVIDCKSVCRCI